MAASSSALSRGFSTEMVTVLDVSDNAAEVINFSVGRRRRLRLDIMRVAIRPAPGQTWIIDRSLGYWTFAAIVQATDPADPGRLYGVGGTFYG